VAWEQARFDSAQADYSAAEPADGLTQVDLVPADLPRDDCSAAPQAVDSVPAEYSPAVDLAPADLLLDDCLAEPQALDSIQADYSAEVGSVAGDCSAPQRADDSVLADYSAAVGSVADDCSAVVDLVPADSAPDGYSAAPQAVDLVPAYYSVGAGSAAVGSVADGCSAAQRADDYSLPAARLDDCSRVVDLAPADLVPDGCLAGPQAADSAPVDYSAA
jgi:hypothetical protein